MNDRNKWTLEERQRKTIQKELNHARLYLAMAQQWNVKFTTEEAPENLRKMDSRIGSIEIALQRTADPKQLNQPELARDLAITLSDYYDKRGRWDDWIKLGPLGLDACIRLGDDYSLGQAYPIICNGIGIMHRMLGRLDESIPFYEEALKWAAKNELKSDALTNIADIYRLRGETAKALDYAQQAVNLGRQTGDKTREAKGLEYLGLTYTVLKKHDEALACYKQAIALREETRNLPRVALVSVFLAAELTGSDCRNDIELALKYYQRAISIEMSLGNMQRVADSYTGIGSIYFSLRNYERAIESFHMALNLHSEIGFFRGVAGVHLRLARAYIETHNSSEALFHILEVYKYKQYMLYPDRVWAGPVACKILLDLAIYLKEEGNFEKVREFAEVAIKIALEAKEIELADEVKKLVTIT